MIAGPQRAARGKPDTAGPDLGKSQAAKADGKWHRKETAAGEHISETPAVRVKRWGKSPPASWWRGGLPNPVRCKANRLRSGCPPRSRVRRPSSRETGGRDGGHPRQNPAYRPATEKAPETGLFLKLDRAAARSSTRPAASARRSNEGSPSTVAVWMASAQAAAFEAATSSMSAPRSAPRPQRRNVKRPLVAGRIDVVRDEDAVKPEPLARAKRPPVKGGAEAEPWSASAGTGPSMSPRTRACDGCPERHLVDGVQFGGGRGRRASLASAGSSATAAWPGKCLAIATMPEPADPRSRPCPGPDTFPVLLRGCGPKAAGSARGRRPNRAQRHVDTHFAEGRPIFGERLSDSVGCHGAVLTRR